MLLKAAQIIQTTTPLIYQGAAGFSHGRGGPHYSYTSQINSQLLYPFNKEQTLKALESITEKPDYSLLLNSKDCIVLDKLSQTGASSITHRVIDTSQKKFYAVKTLDLKSENSIKQVNLALRQYERDHPVLASISGFDYNQRASEVKIITEMPKKTLADAFNPSKTWTNEELKEFLIEILTQMNALKELNAYCHYIEPQHLYVDEVAKSLKLFDFAGFEVDSSKMKNVFGFSKQKMNFEAALDLLARMTSDNFPSYWSKDAKRHFQTNYPEFMPELERLEHKVHKLSRWFEGKNFDRYMMKERSSAISQHHIFDPKTFNQMTLNNIRTILVSKDPQNFNENWAHVNQNIENYSEALSNYHMALDQNVARYGFIHENTLRSYINLAEAYHGKGEASSALDYFRKALNVSQSLYNTDNVLVARLYNGYGKLLQDQKKYSDALDCFKKAGEAMGRAPVKNQTMADEIENNMKFAEYAVKYGDSNFFDAFTNMWKEAAGSYKYFWNSWGQDHHGRHGGFAHKMDKFGRKMEHFGRKMEHMGEYWKKYDWGQLNKNNPNWGKFCHDQWNAYNKNHSWSKWCRGHHNWSNWGWCKKQNNYGGWGGWSRSYSYHSYNGPQCYGPFSCMKRFIIKVIKIWFAFWLIMTIFGIKKWSDRCKDKPENGVGPSGPSQPMDQSAVDERARHRHWWHHHHNKERPQDGSGPNQNTNQSASERSCHRSWWGHGHHHNRAQSEGAVGSNQNVDQSNYEKHRHWWRNHHHNNVADEANCDACKRRQEWRDHMHKKREELKQKWGEQMEKNREAYKAWRKECHEKHEQRRQERQEAMMRRRQYESQYYSQEPNNVSPVVQAQEVPRYNEEMRNEPVQNIGESFNQIEEPRVVSQSSNVEEPVFRHDSKEYFKEEQELNQRKSNVDAFERPEPEVFRKEVNQDEGLSRPKEMFKEDKKQFVERREGGSSSENWKEVSKTFSMSEDVPKAQPKQEKSGNFLWFGVVAILSTIGLSV